LASILNNETIRNELVKHNIQIPHDTYFLGAEHNTTNDKIEIFDNNIPKNLIHILDKIRNDLLKVQA
jgi:uncharacterized protein YbcC (UPF0753/DUF2309 family)